MVYLLGILLTKLFKKLSILQNKSVKIIGGGSYNDRATPFYTKLGILKLADLVKFEKALFVFKFKMKSLPARVHSLANIFVKSAQERI